MEQLPDSFVTGQRRDLKKEMEELRQQAELLGTKRFWEEFSKLSQELIKHVEAERRARELITKSPLPEYLYHVTTVVNAERIFKEGLRKGFSKDNVDTHSVSLSDGVTLGLYSANKTQNTPRENLVVLKIKTAGLPREQFLSMLPFQNPSFPKVNLEEVRFVGEVIPAAHITAAPPAEVQALIAEETARDRRLLEKEEH